MSTHPEAAAIEQMVTAWHAAMMQLGEAGAEGWASFMTEDGIVLAPGVDRIDGRAAARELGLTFTTAPGFQINWHATQIDVADDGKHAHVIGEFSLSMNDEDGNTVSDRGKFFDLLEKQADGSWLCKIGCWNSSVPAE